MIPDLAILLLDSPRATVTHANTSGENSMPVQTGRTGFTSTVEKRELSYTVGGHLNWGSHYGKQYRSSLKN